MTFPENILFKYETNFIGIRIRIILRKKAELEIKIKDECKYIKCNLRKIILLVKHNVVSIK